MVDGGAGCGLRQREISSLPVDEVDPLPGVLHKLLFSTAAEGGAVWRNAFTAHAWKPALAAAGPIARAGEAVQGSARRRHARAPALLRFGALDAGESVRALIAYLGRADAGFTLRTCTRLMPSGGARTRKAVDAMYRTAREPPTAP